jgi:protein-tyrosine phosphatase
MSSKEESQLTNYRGFYTTDEAFCRDYNNKIFIRLPIPDRGIISDELVKKFVECISDAIGKHLTVFIHCKGGKGRLAL